MKYSQPKHRQLSKQRCQFKRKEQQRQANKTTLIVCEGRCTEPYYFKGLLDFLGINNAACEIIAGDTQANAVSIVERASRRFQEIPRDFVFVVIDGEQHDLQRALKKCQIPIQRSNRRLGRPEVRIQPIISTPCFEFWLLLHFCFTSSPFSSFDDILPALQKYLPNYTKELSGVKTLFQQVLGSDKHGIERALVHAKKLREENEHTDTYNPATNVDELVLQLNQIHVTEQHGLLKLSQADQKAFIDALLDPPEPNAALIRAAKRSRKKVLSK